MLIRRGDINFKFQILNSKTKPGFTLLEIVLIVFIVSVMISGIIPLFLNSITSNRASAYYSIAYKAADSIIEENRVKTFEEVTSKSGTVEGLPSGNTYILTVTDAPETEGGELMDEYIKRLDLEITWFFKSERKINISTYVTDGGIGR